MKLSFSTDAYRHVALPEALSRLRKHGFEAVEINAIPGFEPHILADVISDSEVDAIRRKIDELGIRVSAIQGLSYLLAEDGKSSNYTMRCVDIAVKLGSPSVLIASGREPEGSTRDRKSLERCLIENLKICARHAEDSGVSLIMEPEPGLLIDNTPDILRIIGEVGSPAVKFNLCLPHVISIGEDEQESLKLAGRHIGYVHVADVRNRIHEHLIPGEGDVDFPGLIARLNETGYEGYLSLDLYPFVDEPDRAASEGYAYMKRLLGL